MSISKMSDGCIFGGKADICKEFDGRRSSHGREELNPTNQSAFVASEIEPIGRADENDARTDKEVASIRTRSFIASPETCRTLSDNLDLVRLWFMRARNITMNQLNVYKDEATEHMHEIKRIIDKELENPDASARYVAQELVKGSMAVIRNQQALNRIEMEELVKHLDSMLDSLTFDVKVAKGLAEEKSDQRSFTELILEYGHWCFFVLCVFFVLIMGLTRYLPAFEEYF